MRKAALALDELTAVEGVIDEEGASSLTNANRTLFDLVEEVADRAFTFSSSTQVLVFSTNEMLINMQKSVYSKQADLSELTAVELARKTKEAKELKKKFNMEKATANQTELVEEETKDNIDSDVDLVV